MKDLMNLVAICKEDLDSLGIKYVRVSNWTINTRPKCRLGQCRKIAGNLFDISISAMLLADEVDFLQKKSSQIWKKEYLEDKIKIICNEIIIVCSCDYSVITPSISSMLQSVFK